MILAGHRTLNDPINLNPKGEVKQVLDPKYKQGSDYVVFRRRLYKKTFAKPGTLILVIRMKKYNSIYENHAVVKGGLDFQTEKDVCEMLREEIRVTFKV